MNKLLLDSWALIEILGKGPNFSKVSQLMHGNQCFTTTLNLYEVYYHLKEENGVEKAEEAARIIAMNLTLLPIEARTAIDAANMREFIKKGRSGIGAIDILTYVTAQNIGAQLITGDSDFKGLKGVILL